MTLDLSTVVQALLAVVGALSAIWLKSAVTELKSIRETVAEHGRSLSAGNEKFQAMNREIGDLRSAIRDIERDGRSGRRR